MDTKSSSDSAPVNWSERARKLLLANLANLGRKVLAGEVLTAAEIRVLEKAQEEEKAPLELAQDLPTFAHTQMELAATLGLSRQTVHYHIRRPGAPGRRPDGSYDVQAWRSYFEANGRVNVSKGDGATYSSNRPKVPFDFGDGLATGLERIGDNLPDNLRKALTAAGITFTQRKADAAAVFLFLCASSHVNTVLTEHGFPSVFEPFEDGSPYWPEAIGEAGKRAKLAT